MKSPRVLFILSGLLLVSALLATPAYMRSRVVPTNAVPEATGDWYRRQGGIFYVGPLLANDSDAEHDPMFAQIVTPTIVTTGLTS